MKRNILVIAVAVVFAACNNKPAVQPSTTTTQFSAPDTSGLAAFKQMQAAKEQQDFVEMSGVNQTTETVYSQEPVQQPKAAPQVIYRTAPAREAKVVRTVKGSSSGTRRSVSRNDESAGNEGTSSTGSESYPSAGTTGGTGIGTGTNDGPIVASAPAEIPEEKKGWSKAAKGTAIGAGSGAVLGAIISKNKTKGAVIGGVIGAAGGYVLGRKQDKKDGRY